MKRCAITLACLLGACLSVADAGTTTDAIAAIERRAAETHSDAVLILHGDTALLERYSGGGDEPIELMSVTKSVVALVVGRLLHQGLIDSLDTPVARWYPEWNQGRKRDITLRMLMDHSSGLQNVPTTGVEIYPAPDVVQLALAAELESEPGTRFAYNNKAVNLIAGIVARASGQPLDAYAGEHLFAPMGIEPGPWFADPAGNPHGMAGLSLTARDAAKLGQLVLDRGRWHDQVLLDPGDIDALLAASALADESGLLWWRRPAWVSFSVDDDSFELLSAHGIDASLIQALRPLHGNTYTDFAALSSDLARTLGEHWRQRWAQDVVARSGIGPWRAFNAQPGPVAAYEANGDLGQYLVVIPSADLVGVRQIRARDDFQPSDGFPEFTEMMLRLAATIDPSLQPPGNG